MGYEEQISRSRRYSRSQPVWHLVLLSIATFGIYEIYWFYRNWRDLKDHKRLAISPGWKTAGLFVPVYGLILAYRQLKEIKEGAAQGGVIRLYDPGSILAAWIILNALWKLPDPAWMLSFLSIWPLAIVQRTLNAFWQKEEDGLPVRTGLSGGQITLVVIGGLWFLLVIVGMMLPE